MRLTSRPWITAGVAFVGTSLIAATPVVRAVPDIQTETAAVQLTAGGFDDVSLAQLFTNASTSFTNNILNPFLGAPFPAPQQVGENFLGYLGTVFTDPSQIGDIPNEIQTNLTNALKAPFEPFHPFGSAPYLLPSLSSTPITTGFDVGACYSPIGCLDIDPTFTLGGHSDMLNWLINGFPLVLNLGSIDLGFLGSIDLGSINFGTLDLLNLLVLGNSDLENQIRPLLELMGSPASGVAWGTFGTIVSPIAQTLDDTVHIFNALQGGDVTTAFNDLLDMPINSTNAFFEGYGNAYNLLEELGIPPILGTTPELDLGGLFSPAGSFFNALGFDFEVGGTSTYDLGFLGDISLTASAFLRDPATMVGPIASMLETGQAIAQAIGWDDVGNQLFNLASMF
ncbi:hypothetical protein [Mycobacterium sp.]|uniref:hypothetical protein n=1 Tax=Mycobacterium sp. TaxID=1785 RepID=UPI003C74ABB6